MLAGKIIWIIYYNLTVSVNMSSPERGLCKHMNMILVHTSTYIKLFQKQIQIMFICLHNSFRRSLYDQGVVDHPDNFYLILT